MIQIEDKILSIDIFKKHFLCDLNACKGACCVEGDSGAPLTSEEVNSIGNHINLIKEEMSPSGLSAIENKDFYYVDEDGEEVTSLVNNKECVFVFRDQNNIAKCSIESAYRKNKINFNKPISCHLYPIRVRKYESFKAINIHNWHICKPACDCGSQLNIPVFKFLKEAIIRSWSKEFYDQLEDIYQQFFQKTTTE